MKTDSFTINKNDDSYKLPEKHPLGCFLCYKSYPTNSFLRIRSAIMYFFLYMISITMLCACQISHSDEEFYKKMQTRAIVCCDTARHLIKTGDLITRTGNDFTSASLRRLNTKDQTYSHIGIASIENGVIFVYHAVGGESNPNEKLRRDLFSCFVNGYDNQGFGIFRFKCNDSTVKAIQQQAVTFYRQGILFDMAFDLTTDDKMYCSEFVAKTIEKVLAEPSYFLVDTISGKPYIAPDAIFLHPDCYEIKRLRYF